MSRARPWYDSYELLREEVDLLRKTFRDRCKQLNQEPGRILNAFSRDVISRAVFESNWQEGIEVERGRTKELADIVFEDFDHLDIPHLDFARILNHHRRQVIALRKRRVSQAELAAYNLSVAHTCLWWIVNELLQRQVAFLSVAIKNLETQFAQTKNSMPEQVRRALQDGFDVINESLDDRTTLGAPFAGTFKTRGDLFKKYLEFNFQTLLKPFRIAHIHLLHRILLMGIKPAQKCGHFRKKGVHVSNPDLLFPPAEAVPPLMEEFCNDFPSFVRLPGRDNILLAAKFSFRFVRIHPYGDGNGRVSRLLMNLILVFDDLPVYLKADKKGRHRYSQALRRADRGNLHPLASLIALSLKEIYGKALASMKRSIPSKSAHSSQSVASDGASLSASEIASKPQ